MKNIVIFILLVTSSFVLNAQCDIAQQNASLSQGQINIGQTAELKFDMVNLGTGPCAYAPNAVKVTISLPSKAYNFQNLDAPLTGKGLYFDWTYNAQKRVLVGINHTTMPTGAKEENIMVKLVGHSIGKAIIALNIQVTDGSDNTNISNDPKSLILEVAANPLPISLIDFTGKTIYNGNELLWKVASENNFSHYELERSNNTSSFEKIAQIPGNNTNETNNYLYTDINTNKKNWYYRLRFVDIGGKYSYSKVIYLKVTDDWDVKLFPNPASKHFVIENIDKNLLEITVIDNLGKVILAAQKINNENSKVDISSLQSGIYYVKINTIKGAVYKKILVEN